MSTHDPQVPLKARRRWVLPVAVVVASALVVAGVGIVLGITAPDTEPTAPSASPTADPTPTAPAEIPADSGVNYAPANFAGWTVANVYDSDTRFSADRDTAQDGAVSLRVDRPIAVTESSRALTQTIPVDSGTTYEFSVWVKWPTSNSESDPVALTLGEGGPKVVEFPAGTAEWTQVEWSYKTGAGQVSLPISLDATGVTVGLMLDQFEMVAEGSSNNLLANPSFEESTPVSNQITNETLLLTSGSAGINVVWNAASVEWTVSDQAGTAVRSGAGSFVGGNYRIALDDLPQGYYQLRFTPSGESSVNTAISILDPTPDGSLITDERFGVGAHVEESQYDDSATTAASVGVSSVRNDAYWNLTEKTAGQYAFPAVYDVSFAQMKDAGLAPLAISNGANNLYDSGKIPTSAAGIQAYANYTAALADHYDLQSVEIFNELNGQRFNDGVCGVGADCYFPLLKAAYEKVKAVSPETLVLGPANGNQDDPFLTELYRIGGLSYLDAVTYHPYVAVPELLIPDIQGAQARIREYNNGESKPIWLTEFGWTASGGTDEATQANYLVRAEVIALANGVERVFWYDLVNDAIDASHEGNFGLFRRESASVPFEPKPAAMAQALLIRKIHEKQFVSMDAIANGYSYVYGTGQGATRVAWSTSGAQATYATTGPVTVTTAMGAATVVEPVDGLVTVQLGEEPVYVEGPVTAASAPAG